MQNLRVNSKRAYWLIAASIAFLALIMVGCGNPGPVVNPNALKNPPQTWVSLSPGTSEFMATFSCKLIGRGVSDNYPRTIERLPIVASVKPDYERIAEMKPDVIVLDSSVYNPTDMAKLKELNIPIVEISGDSVDAFEKSLYAAASAMHSEVNINNYVINIRQAKAVALGDPFLEPHKVALIMSSPNSDPMIAGVDSFYADLIRCAAGDPVGPSGNKFVPIDPEALLKLDPDVVVVASDTGDYSGFLNDPRFAGMKAVKSRHVIGIGSDLVLRRGDRVDSAIAALHKAIGVLLRNR